MYAGAGFVSCKSVIKSPNSHQSSRANGPMHVSMCGYVIIISIEKASIFEPIVSVNIRSLRERYRSDVR